MAHSKMAHTKMTHTKMAHAKMAHVKMAQNDHLTKMAQWSYFYMAPPFTVPCEGRQSRFLHRLLRESSPGSLRGSPSHNRCATPAQLT